MICPARASKSYSAAYKALPLILGREAKADGTGPKPTRGWIVGPTYELAEKEFRYVWEVLMDLGPTHRVAEAGAGPRQQEGRRPLHPHGLGLGNRRQVGRQAPIPSGRAARLGDPERGGPTAGRYLDPVPGAPPRHHPRLRHPADHAGRRRPLAVRAVHQGPGGERPCRLVLLGRHRQPDLPDRRVRERRKPSTASSTRSSKSSTSASGPSTRGVVYGHDFDITRNVIDLPPDGIPPDWRRIRSIDFGYRDPFVCLWAALTPDGEIWIYREHYQTQRAMAEHAAVIRQRSEGEHILYTVADSSEPQSIADLRRLGVPAMEANRDRRAGRMLVGDYLRSWPPQVCSGRGAGVDARDRLVPVGQGQGQGRREGSDHRRRPRDGCAPLPDYEPAPPGHPTVPHPPQFVRRGDAANYTGKGPTSWPTLASR